MKHGKGSNYEGKAIEDLMGKTTGKLLADPTKVEAQEKLIQQDIKTQAAIDNYNKDLEYASDDVRFNNKIFVGNTIIVKMEKLNWFVPSEIDPDLFSVNPLQFVAAVTPDHPRGKIVQNPLPYNYRAVVVAIGDEVSKYRTENNLQSLAPGDIVELNWFDLKNYRYYPDKNKIDQITLDSPEAPNYEGFAKIPAQFVEAIVKPELFELVYGKSREDMYTVNIHQDKIDTESSGSVGVHQMAL